MNKKTFFALFGKQQPSVKSFYALLECKTPETKETYYNYACSLFMNDYQTVPKRYQMFLTNLVKHDWQRFFDYLMHTSGFHSLRGGVQNRQTIIRLLHILMADRKNVDLSYAQMAFFASLSFCINLKINSLSHNIRQCRFTPETFFELAEYVDIYL